MVGPLSADDSAKSLPPGSGARLINLNRSVRFVYGNG